MKTPERKKDLVTDIAPTAVDIVMEVVGGLPVGNVIKTGLDQYVQYKARQLQKKITAFLTAAENEQKVYDDFNSQFASDTEKSNFWEQLINSIDRIESEYKAEVLGRVFKKVLVKKVNKDDFAVILHIVDVTSYLDIKYFLETYYLGIGDLFLNNGSHQRLSNSGLLEESFEVYDEKDMVMRKMKTKTKAKYKASNFGSILRDCNNILIKKK